MVTQRHPADTTRPTRPEVVEIGRPTSTRTLALYNENSATGHVRCFVCGCAMVWFYLSHWKLSCVYVTSKPQIITRLESSCISNVYIWGATGLHVCIVPPLIYNPILTRRIPDSPLLKWNVLPGIQIFPKDRPVYKHRLYVHQPSSGLKYWAMETDGRSYYYKCKKTRQFKTHCKDDEVTSLH